MSDAAVLNIVIYFLFVILRTVLRFECDLFGMVCILDGLLLNVDIFIFTSIYARGPDVFSVCSKTLINNLECE